MRYEDIEKGRPVRLKDSELQQKVCGGTGHEMGKVYVKYSREVFANTPIEVEFPQQNHLTFMFGPEELESAAGKLSRHVIPFPSL